MAINPIVWFEIYVQDMPRAKAFYEGVLEIDLRQLPDPGMGIAEMWTFPSDPESTGATGALVKMQDGPQGFGGVLIYFACENCAIECARAPKLGGAVKREKFSIGQYGFLALISDTEGNMIGLQSMR